tara:strand:- start:1296 stop:1838 length:543 start_codon:yes stop_codon:yes gene_type:complete
MAKSLARPKQPSRVFDQLTNVKLSELSEQDYNRIMENVFIESDNMDFIQDLSNVINFQQKPRGLQLCQASQSGIVNSTGNVVLLEIPAKKTYDIQAITAITTTGVSQIDYLISGIPPVGLDYLVKTVDYTDAQRGITVDLSTMGDFLISGTQTDSTYLVALRRSGTGSIAGHNVFFREVN